MADADIVPHAQQIMSNFGMWWTGSMISAARMVNAR
jgi:hypothetical protein